MTWATLIQLLGGIGLFLLGMGVMTDGLRTLAGSALRSVLARAAATPVRGAFWGAFVTLLVQSSSATTMTTIGLVSAGLLTFSQAIGVVFGAAIGTTGTGWLVALLGVKVSLTAAAMPMIFVGALVRLLGSGRWAGAGGALAGFALLLVGLTEMQGGMEGLARAINPADLPAVSGGLSGALGLLQLVIVGVILTTLMQSSSASVAITISALHAGAIGPDQAVALVIGQNVGTAVSSGLAAVGATTPAKRTAVAYILFKVITAAIMIALFPLYLPLVVDAAGRYDPPILLAAYHTAYNVLGVGLLLPMSDRFARVVERLVRSRGPELARHLDRSVQTVPEVAVEAARRTLAQVLALQCRGLRHLVTGARDQADPDEVAATLRQCGEALEQARGFLAGLTSPPESARDRAALESALHALDHIARQNETAREHIDEQTGAAFNDPDATRGVDLCARVLALAADLAERVSSGPDSESARIEPGGAAATPNGDERADVTTLQALASELADLRRAHRPRALASVARGERSATDAIGEVERVRRLDRLAYHAWRAMSHLVLKTDAGEQSAAGS